MFELLYLSSNRKRNQSVPRDFEKTSTPTFLYNYGNQMNEVNFESFGI